MRTVIENRSKTIRPYPIFDKKNFEAYKGESEERARVVGYSNKKGNPFVEELRQRFLQD